MKKFSGSFFNRDDRFVHVSTRSGGVTRNKNTDKGFKNRKNPDAQKLGIDYKNNVIILLQSA